MTHRIERCCMTKRSEPVPLGQPGRVWRCEWCRRLWKPDYYNGWIWRHATTWERFATWMLRRR